MQTKRSIASVLLLAALILSGCAQTAEPDMPPSAPEASQVLSEPVQSEADMEELVITNIAQTPNPEPEVIPESESPSYIDQVVQEVIGQFLEPDMDEYDKAKAAFDYLIEFTSLAEPIGLELWRIRGNTAEQPGFVENRSLSILLYGIGMCEDYAAAYTMLLRGMGIEAEYVPGLTYSAAGTGLVDHAWTVARIDGVWYHFDPQLEDNISRRDTTRYKYFMRGDATMSGSHRWGQNLIDSGLLTAEQNEEIGRNHLAPACPQDYPTPAIRQFTSAPMPDIMALQVGLDAEFQAYESANGPLEEIELNIIPPVFGLVGYGPPD